MKKILIVLCLFIATPQAFAQSVSDAYSSTTPGQAYEPDYSDHKKKQADDDSGTGIYDRNNTSPDHNAASGHEHGAGHNGGYGGGYGGGGHR